MPSVPPVADRLRAPAVAEMSTASVCGEADHARRAWRAAAPASPGAPPVRCATAGGSAVVASSKPGRAATPMWAQLEQRAPVAPGVELHQLVGAHQEHDRRIRPQFGAHVAQRVDGVGRRRRARFPAVDHDSASRAAPNASSSIATRSASLALQARFLPRLTGREMRSSVGLQQVGEQRAPARRGRRGSGRKCRPAGRRRRRHVSASQSRCDQEVGVQRRFRRARLRLPVVAPVDDRRHRHQDRFGASARLQAEQGAAVAHQVELDVAAAPVGLEVAFALAVRRVLAALRGSAGRRRGSRRRRSAPSRTTARSRLVEVVEEDAADAARLVAVLQVEIVVAPLLEARMQVGAERRQRVAADSGGSGARLPRSRSTASGPCRRRTTTPAPRLRRSPRRSARSCGPSARTDCADAAPATRPSLPRRGRPVRDARRIADGGSAVARARARNSTPPRSNTLPSFDQARDAAAAFGALPARRAGTACRRRLRARATMRACRSSSQALTAAG